MSGFGKKGCLFLSLSIGGCSAMGYEEPVAGFFNATVNAERALIGLDNEVTTAYTALQSKRVAEKEVQPRFLTTDSSRDCGIASTRCRIELVDSVNNSSGAFPPDPPVLENMIILMTSIRVYAQSLTDIVNADTSAKVGASVNATFGSVASLAESVQKLGGAKESADPTEYTTPVGALVNWLVGNYVEKVKLDALRRATTEADPVITKAAGVIEASTRTGGDALQIALANAVSMRQRRVADEPTATSFRLLIADAAAYDHLLLAKPEDVFTRMKNAHHALASNLQESGPPLGQVMEKVQSFLTEAQTFHHVIGLLGPISKDEES